MPRGWHPCPRCARIFTFPPERLRQDAETYEPPVHQREYLERCGILRKYFEDPALTTDIITGFPGETEEDFRESAEFVEKVSFFETHVFPYSRREGTRAAAMDGQLPEAVKKQRSHVLLELDCRKREEYLSRALGKETEVLLEEETELEGRRAWAGYTREYRKVVLISDQELATPCGQSVPGKYAGENFCCADDKLIAILEKLY